MANRLKHTQRERERHMYRKREREKQKQRHIQRHREKASRRNRSRTNNTQEKSSNQEKEGKKFFRKRKEKCPRVPQLAGVLSVERFMARLMTVEETRTLLSRNHMSGLAANPPLPYPANWGPASFFQPPQSLYRREGTTLDHPRLLLSLPQPGAPRRLLKRITGAFDRCVSNRSNDQPSLSMILVLFFFTHQRFL